VPESHPGDGGGLANAPPPLRPSYGRAGITRKLIPTGDPNPAFFTLRRLTGDSFRWE
jgi:hypothetical protein